MQLCKLHKLASIGTSSKDVQVIRDHNDTLNFISGNNVSLIYATSANQYQQCNDIPKLCVATFDYHQLCHSILTELC